MFMGFFGDFIYFFLSNCFIWDNRMLGFFVLSFGSLRFLNVLYVVFIFFFGCWLVGVVLLIFSIVMVFFIERVFIDFLVVNSVVICWLGFFLRILLVFLFVFLVLVVVEVVAIVFFLRFVWIFVIVILVRILEFGFGNLFFLVFRVFWLVILRFVVFCRLRFLLFFMRRV